MTGPLDDLDVFQEHAQEHLRTSSDGETGYPEAECCYFARLTIRLCRELRAARAALAPLANARYADSRGVEFGIVSGADMLRAQAVLKSGRAGA